MAPKTFDNTTPAPENEEQVRVGANIYDDTNLDGTPPLVTVEDNARLTVGDLRKVLNDTRLDSKLDNEVVIAYYMHPDLPQLGKTELEVFDVSTVTDLRSNEKFLVIATYSPDGIEMLKKAGLV